MDGYEICTKEEFFNLVDTLKCDDATKESYKVGWSYGCGVFVAETETMYYEV